LGASGRVDAATAAQIGQILGVDVVIIGSITQFDLQKKQSGGSFIIFSTAKTETDAFVKLNIRAINPTTAEIITTAQGDGTANQSDGSTVVLGVGGGSKPPTKGNYSVLPPIRQWRGWWIISMIKPNKSPLHRARSRLSPL